LPWLSLKILSDIASGNIVVLVGKQQANKADPRILAVFQQVGQNIANEFYNTANQWVQQAALAITQILANIASGNIILIGKRQVAEVDPRILAVFQQLGQNIANEFYNAANQFVQQSALAVTQVLAAIASGNIQLIGKRAEKEKVFAIDHFLHMLLTVIDQQIGTLPITIVDGTNLVGKWSSQLQANNVKSRVMTINDLLLLLL